MTTDRETLAALWAGTPAVDLTADITEIITKVGADNPAALAEEIAYVVMQHGRPVARSET